MIKNNILTTVKYGIFALILFSANISYAVSPKLSSLKTPITKFALVMFGIIFMTMLIYIGLAIYNKIFVSNKIKNYELNKYNLDEPLDKDDAIVKFITKNNLK